MAIKPPSRKIIHLILAVFGFFIIFFGYKPLASLISNTDFRGTLSYISKPGFLSAEVRGASEIDSDKDGLKDWQEILWKSDPKNPDTDGDGTKDGEEVKLGRDPNKPGPDDIYVGVKPYDENTSPFDRDNLSDQLSRSLFSQFMSANQNNNLTPADEQDIVASSLGGLSPEIIENSYVLGDIKTLDQSGVQGSKAFGNNFANTIEETSGKFEGKDTDEIGSVYESLAEKLLELKVPFEVKYPYLQLLNNYAALGKVFDMIAGQKEDPVKALLALKTYDQLKNSNAELLTTIADYFKKNGIIFGNEEPGAVWNSI